MSGAPSRIPDGKRGIRGYSILRLRAAEVYWPVTKLVGQPQVSSFVATAGLLNAPANAAAR